ncbi:unnamed protein product [Peronospora belbahrii]|uniref:EGF-like domain-containing protein n=1 Tax=Peronospora belbahrii TaxID=622444 RepID=A0ABN8CN03_9STRA|nr:unnamed protein product [Peronospora belbahrii]
MKNRSISSIFSLGFLLFIALNNQAQVESLDIVIFGAGDNRMRHGTSLDLYAPADRGCALCRNEENCSLAVHNQSMGVFCSDILATFQPCCCSFRNECMTTIFSDSCECFDGIRKEEIMTTRVYLFMGLSFIAWGFLVYDKMCAGPYKVMNSNHQLLSSLPSAAVPRGEDTAVDGTVDNDSEDGEVLTGVGTVAVEIEDEARELHDDNNTTTSVICDA